MHAIVRTSSYFIFNFLFIKFCFRNILWNIRSSFNWVVNLAESTYISERARLIAIIWNFFPRQLESSYPFHKFQFVLHIFLCFLTSSNRIFQILSRACCECYRRCGISLFKILKLFNVIKWFNVIDLRKNRLNPTSRCNFSWKQRKINVYFDNIWQFDLCRWSKVGCVFDCLFTYWELYQSNSWIILCTSGVQYFIGFHAYWIWLTAIYRVTICWSQKKETANPPTCINVAECANTEWELMLQTT